MEWKIPRCCPYLPESVQAGGTFFQWFWKREWPTTQPETDMQAQVAIVMGSRSDWPTMKGAADILQQLDVEHEVEVVSAHRTPDKLMAFAEQAASRGIKVIIAGAGGAAHLPGMIASKTCLPVLGVPVQSKTLNGLDSLLSIVQMPKGIAVGTLAIGTAGAFNAGLLAGQILALGDAELSRRVEAFRQTQTEDVLASPDPREA
jgi:5-(carboxyamino)imidazole ribonucleotide mutase